MDLTTAADLKYYAIPDLQQRLKTLESKKAEKEAAGEVAESDIVSPDQIAEGKLRLLVSSFSRSFHAHSVADCFFQPWILTLGSLFCVAQSKLSHGGPRSLRVG